MLNGKSYKIYKCLNVFQMLKIRIPMVGGGGFVSEKMKKKKEENEDRRIVTSL